MAQEVQLVGLSLAEFRKIVKEVVKECIKEELKRQNADQALSFQQAARFLNVSAPTLRKYVKESVIRIHCLGPRRKVFYLSELEEDIKRLPGLASDIGMSNLV